LAQVGNPSHTGATAMQKALSLAVLLGAMVQLQGCGGDEATPKPPVATTVAPTTAAPTDPPPAPAASDLVITGSFKMKGLTAAQLDNANVKAAVAKGIASSLGVEAQYVEITGVARRLMMGRQLSDEATITYKITIPKEKGAAALAEIKAAVTTAATAIATEASALTAMTAAITAAIKADPDISADIKTAADSIEIPVSGLVPPTATGGEAVVDDHGGHNSTRRLSFSFITSDEPLIL